MNKYVQNRFTIVNELCQVFLINASNAYSFLSLYFYPIIIFIVFPILNKVRKLFFIQRILLHKGILFFLQFIEVIVFLLFFGLGIIFPSTLR